MTGKSQTGDSPNGNKASLSLHLVFGSDEYFVASKARKVVDALCPPDQQALGLEIIDGQADQSADALAALKQVLEAVCTVGFLGEGKTIWFRDVRYLSDTPVGKVRDVKARVEALVVEIKAGLPAGNHLVVSASKVDKRSAFYKLCKAQGTLFEYQAPEKEYLQERHAQDIARKALAKAGLKMGEDAMKCFLERAGTSTRQIVQEVEKLLMYLGEPGVVPREAVEAVVAPSREAVMWSLADSVTQRDLRTSLTLLRQLLQQKESVMGIIMTIEKRFRLLTRLRASMDRGWLRMVRGGRGQEARWEEDPELEELFVGLGRDDPRKMHPYRTLLLSNQACKYTLEQLSQINERILRTHELLVSSPVPAQILMEVLIVEITGNKKKLAVR